MIHPKAIILIQCRYDSKRAPGKILRELKPGLSCLEYLIQRLGKTSYNCIIATTDRDADSPIFDAYLRLKGKYKYLLGCFRGDEKNIARRLYDASKGYDYIIRVTGDDFFVDTAILDSMAVEAVLADASYTYPENLIRGCDSDVFKRDSLVKALGEYDMADVESIEFLFKNTDTSKVFKVPGSYKNPSINLTLDTEDDWKVVQLVWKKLSVINYCFNTWDIVEFITRNSFITDMNKVPLVTVYTVFKDYPIKWLQNAIASLQEQTFTDYEFILIDYGSKQIHQYLKEVNNEEKVRTFFTDELNFIDSINLAIKKARGKYILRLDADDMLMPDALEKMVNYLTEHNFYSAVIPNFDALTDKLLIHNVPGDKDNIMSCALIEKKKYSFVKFKETQSFRDGTTLLKSFKEYGFKTGYLAEPLFIYRVHDRSLTHDPSRRGLIKETDAAINDK